MTARPGYASYHNHPGYCDGAGTVADYAAAALAAGVTRLGLSCHAPVPFETTWTMPLAALAAYRAEVRAVAARHAGRLPIALGLEVDFLHPGLVPGGVAYQTAHILDGRLDYAVASVHFVGRDATGQPWTIDETAASFARQLDEVYAGDARRLIEDYVASTVAMAPVAAGWGLPVVVGHVDKAKMWNIGGRYFDEESSWYRAAVEGALEAIRDAGLVVEINTAGLRREHGESYPGPHILRRCRDLGIPMTISADAHLPEQVAADFDTAVALLRAAGHRSVMVLDGGTWVEQPLRAPGEG